MVCIKLVKRNVLVHFWPLLKAISTSSTSAFTNRSIVWLRRDGRDFENERMKNKSMVGLACLNVESYISHVRRKGSQVGVGAGQASLKPIIRFKTTLYFSICSQELQKQESYLCVKTRRVSF